MTLRISSVLGIALVGAIASAQYAHILTTATTTSRSVSNNGVAVAASGSNNAMWTPIVQWGLINIGGTTPGAAAISADGMFFGGNSPGPDGKAEMSIYSVATGLWTAYGGAGGYSGSTRSTCWGLSSDGSTVFGFGYGTPQSTSTFTGIRPLAVRNGVMSDFSIIQTANSINRLTGSSADGSIVTGRCRETSSTDGTFYWSVPGTPNPLYLTGTTFLAEPAGMSGDGRYIVGAGNSATSTVENGVTINQPYIYDTVTGTTELIPSIAGLNGNVIPAGSTLIAGLATGISGDGNTVIGFFRRQGPSIAIDKTWGFIWKRGVGVTTLDQWFADNGLSTTITVNGNPVTLYPIANGISADGQTLVGNEFFFPASPPSIGRGFMVTPGRGISGSVTLQNMVGVSTAPGTWQLIDGSNTVVDSGSYGLGPAGQYQIVTNVAAGDYQLAFKGRTHLVQRVPVTLASNAADVNFSLINGDVDGNNEVGPNDFSLLSVAFGSSDGDSNWNAFADLDLDAEVGPSDFSILSGSFGLVGD